MGRWEFEGGHGIRSQGCLLGIVVRMDEAEEMPQGLG